MLKLIDCFLNGHEIFVLHNINYFCLMRAINMKENKVMIKATIKIIKIILTA